MKLKKDGLPYRFMAFKEKLHNPKKIGLTDISLSLIIESR